MSNNVISNTNDLVYRLTKRAEIRRQIQGRKSVQEGKPDRLADLLEEAAARIEYLESITFFNGENMHDMKSPNPPEFQVVSEGSDDSTHLKSP